MKQAKIMVVLGTRPEAIKFASVIKELEKEADHFDTRVVVTAQHREMLDQVLRVFGIVPHYDLRVMEEAQDLFGVTSRILTKLKPVLEKEQPDLLLVQGDTTTTFAATLAAFYLKIPIGHIEAGLRTFNKHQPFPEEMNRRLTTALANLHFAPTEKARNNLLIEGTSKEKIFVTGNTGIDALLEVAQKDYPFRKPPLSEVDFSKKIITVTAHRRESWGKPIEAICRAIKEIIKNYSDVEVVFSVHLNPRVRSAVAKNLRTNGRLHLTPPLSYEPFVQLMGQSYLILTDSGGIQEEAPSLGKPVLVLREVTERPEAIESGTAKLVGREPERIVAATSELLDNTQAYTEMAQASNPYGDGQAAQRIVEVLSYELGFSQLLPHSFSSPLTPLLIQIPPN